jgi:hypothetical protein
MERIFGGSIIKLLKVQIVKKPLQIETLFAFLSALAYPSICKARSIYL